MKQNLIGTTYSSAQFSWNPKTENFSADISDVPQVLRELWNDSMDLGFAMYSIKTGAAAYFTLTDMHRDADGDVEFWEFTPTISSIKNNPGLFGVNVIIYND